MSARLVLDLQDLDAQLTVWEQQRQRCGLAPYLERQRGLQQRLIEVETAMAEAETAIDTKEPLLSRQPELQDEVLAAMLLLEELPPQLERLRSDLEELEQELQEARLEETQRQHGLDTRLNEGRAQREKWLSELGPLGSQYLRSRQIHGQPLAGVNLGRCGRCRMQLPDHEQRQLRLGNPQTCSSCQSLLLQGLADKQSRSR